MAYLLVPETVPSDFCILIYFIFPVTLQYRYYHSPPFPDEETEAEARLGSMACKLLRTGSTEHRGGGSSMGAGTLSAGTGPATLGSMLGTHSTCIY